MTKTMKEIMTEFVSDPERLVKAHMVMMQVSETYDKAKKRLEGFTTFHAVVAELGIQFPNCQTLIENYEKEVLLCTMQHEDWSEDKILAYVASEMDRRLSILENKYNFKVNKI